MVVQGVKCLPVPVAKVVHELIELFISLNSCNAAFSLHFPFLFVSIPFKVLSPAS